MLAELALVLHIKFLKIALKAWSHTVLKLITKLLLTRATIAAPGPNAGTLINMNNGLGKTKILLPNQ